MDKSIPNKIKFPECFNDKVKIVNFSKRHLTQQYVDWLNDPEVVRYSEQRHRQHTLSSCNEYYISQISSLNYFLAVELNNLDKTHIGNIGVNVDPYNNKADVSIIIGDKSVWGTGVGSRAWILVMDVLVKKLGYRLITAGTMETNISMIKLMKRSKMTIDSILPNRFIFENKQVGLVAASYCPSGFINRI